MKASPWAFVVAIALLLGAGFALGYFGGRDTDAERQVWNTQTDSILGAALRQHRRALDSARVIIAAAEQRALDAQQRADAERRARLAARGSEDSLRSTLAAAVTRGDSLAARAATAALLPVVTASRDAAVREANELRSTVAEQRAAAGAFFARAAADSSRILTLEKQLASVPKPAAECKVVGLPCPVVIAGLGVTSGTGTAAGLTVAVGFPIRGRK